MKLHIQGSMEIILGAPVKSSPKAEEWISHHNVALGDQVTKHPQYVSIS